MRVGCEYLCGNVFYVMMLLDGDFKEFVGFCDYFFGMLCGGSVSLSRVSECILILNGVLVYGCMYVCFFMVVDYRVLCVLFVVDFNFCGFCNLENYFLYEK